MHVLYCHEDKSCVFFILHFLLLFSTRWVRVLFLSCRFKVDQADLTGWLFFQPFNLSFFIKNNFSANNCFMKNSTPSGNTCFLYPVLYCHEHVYLWQQDGWRYSKFSPKKIFFFLYLPSQRDDERFDKSIINFCQTLIKTPIILRVNDVFYYQTFIKCVFICIFFGFVQ